MPYVTDFEVLPEEREVLGDGEKTVWSQQLLVLVQGHQERHNWGERNTTADVNQIQNFSNKEFTFTSTLPKLSRPCEVRVVTYMSPVEVFLTGIKVFFVWCLIAYAAVTAQVGGGWGLRRGVDPSSMPFSRGICFIWELLLYIGTFV